MDDWIVSIKAGAGDLILDNPGRAAAVALRGAIVAEEGHKFVVADLSNIEGRMLAWLAGEEWKLKAFRDFDQGVGHDLYKIGAGRILRKRPEDVTDDERQIMGKVPELACGFQGAAGAFGTMAALYGLDLSEERVKEIVSQWREQNPAIRQFWYDMEAAAWEATRSPGRTVYCGRIAFNRHKEWLRMQLPSGRVLCYCQPAEIEHPMFEGQTSLSYLGINSYTRKWERIATYGGKLVENAVQAAARDVLKTNSHAIEDAGYAIVLPVHDETVTEVPDEERFTTDELCRILSQTPWWADEKLPLAAGGFECKRYRKE